MTDQDLIDGNGNILARKRDKQTAKDKAIEYLNDNIHEGGFNDNPPGCEYYDDGWQDCEILLQSNCEIAINMVVDSYEAKLKEICFKLSQESVKNWKIYEEQDETQSQGIAIGLDKAIELLKKKFDEAFPK